MRHDPSIFLPVIKRGGLIGLSQKPKTRADYRGLLRNHVAPRDAGGRLTGDCLGRRRMDQISREHVRALHLINSNPCACTTYGTPMLRLWRQAALHYS